MGIKRFMGKALLAGVIGVAVGNACVDGLEVVTNAVGDGVRHRNSVVLLGMGYTIEEHYVKRQNIEVSYGYEWEHISSEAIPLREHPFASKQTAETYSKYGVPVEKGVEILGGVIALIAAYRSLKLD